jgi:hypothetical protein
MDHHKDKTIDELLVHIMETYPPQKGLVISGNHKLNRANTFISRGFGFTHAIVGDIEFGTFSGSSDAVNMYQTIGRLTTRIEDTSDVMMYITKNSFEMALSGEIHVENLGKYISGGTEKKFISIDNQYIKDNKIIATEKNTEPKTRRKKADVEYKIFDSLPAINQFKKRWFGGHRLDGKKYSQKKMINGFICNTIRSNTKVMTTQNILNDIAWGIPGNNSKGQTPFRFHIGYEQDQQGNPINPDQPRYILAFNPNFKK